MVEPFRPQTELLSWRSHGVINDVIDQGATWSFHSEPPPASRANHPSALKYAAQCASELDRLESLGLIEYQPVGVELHHFVSHIHPFGAVAKGDPADPKVRLVVDPTITGVNAHMNPLPLSLPTCRQALAMTKPSSFFWEERSEIWIPPHCPTIEL